MEKLNQLSYKNLLIYLTAIVSFIAGWVITFIGFYADPKGVVDNTVIVVFGQSLTYTAYALGLKEYGEYLIHRTMNKHQRREEYGEE